MTGMGPARRGRHSRLSSPLARGCTGLAAAAVAVMVTLVVGGPHTAFAQSTAPVTVPGAPDVGDTREMIANAAARWGVDPGIMLAIAICESDLDPSAVGPDGAAGLFQIAPRTWKWGAETLGFGDVSPLNPAANAEVAAWLLATLGAGQWGCP